MRSALILLAALLLCACSAAFGLTPTLPDPGFEKQAAGWGWQSYSGVQAGYTLDTKNPHSGKYCVEFTNNSAISPNVYARLCTDVNVAPSTKYELSCWVRAEDAAPEPGGFHFTDWNTYCFNLPTGTYGWQKATYQFTTKPGQSGINIGINIANKCKSFAIDDIVLRPVEGQLKAPGIAGVIITSPSVLGHDTTVPVCVMLDCSAKNAYAYQAAVSIDGKKVNSRWGLLKQGESKLEWNWNTGKTPFGKYECLVRVVDANGAVLASGSATTDVVDSPIFADMAKIEERKREFDSLYSQCKAKGIRLDYPTATKTMLEQFMPFVGEDVRAGLDWRARFAVTDFNRSLDSSITAMKAYLAEPDTAPIARRYAGGRITIDDLSFIGDRVDSTGAKDTGPLFFCGPGHFAQVRKDTPKFQYYGMNIIQVEIGPSAVFPAENKINYAAVKEIATVLDNAAKNNIMVNVLLSPHYFPAWAMQKWPHLGKGGGGFLGYCVDDPDAKRLLEKYLRIVIPMLKDKPALHSLCLSNEPLFYNTQNADNTKEMWVDYLTRNHGDIATLNKRYGTTYAAFADVPYGSGAAVYDWFVFVQQRFAGWHKWMADVIHEMAPGIPTHAKVMSNELNPGAVGWATDQELFANALEINGNDCYIFPSGNAGWPLDPWMQNTGFDLQRSFARKPVFNSENHISPDGSTYYIAPGNFRTALWQGAVHGQGATTIWVWERDFSNRYGFLGNILDRPGCAEAVGLTCLDLNRFATEVTALETQRAKVAIVYSMASLIHHGNEHVGQLYGTYFALDFSGVKIDFISDKQLAAGKGAEYKAVIVPEVETITDAAFAGIQALPDSTRLYLLGPCFARNQYGQKRDEQAVSAVVAKATALTRGDSEKVMWPELRKELSAIGVLPEYSVVDAKTDQPIWGVEWLPAQVGGRTVINMINFLDKPFDVKILRNGQQVEAFDLFSIGGRERVTSLQTLTPVLAEVK